MNRRQVVGSGVGFAAAMLMGINSKTAANQVGPPSFEDRHGSLVYSYDETDQGETEFKHVNGSLQRKTFFDEHGRITAIITYDTEGYIDTYTKNVDGVLMKAAFSHTTNNGIRDFCVHRLYRNGEFVDEFVLATDRDNTYVLIYMDRVLDWWANPDHYESAKAFRESRGR